MQARHYRIFRACIGVVCLIVIIWTRKELFNVGSIRAHERHIVDRCLGELYHTASLPTWKPINAAERRCSAFPDITAEFSALILYLMEEGGIIEDRLMSDKTCAEQLVGYSLATPTDRHALRFLEIEASRLYPLVLFGSRDDNQWGQIRDIMSLHNVQPEVALVDVSGRLDREIILRIIARLSGSSQLPQLYIRGHLLGDYDIVKGMVQEDSLVGFLQGSGVAAEHTDPYLLGRIMGQWKGG